MEVFPSATEHRNASGHFPLALMIENGRQWDDEVGLALRSFPPALRWWKDIDNRFLAHILERASKDCGTDTIFALLNSCPDLFHAAQPRAW